ncbi:DUF397 domain-containing protein [Kibdelosporangium persicum]|uniref:Toxin n=1 Tax=Kibdelosporangium persicum TaxID=2698649 RepID=A0ABX2F5T3_9PSEU|nr:DUF397 domain-containing protein [Kibdelosporangium persicum]NRN66257.1 Toxin [Kibdelosporangium persicum]
MTYRWRKSSKSASQSNCVELAWRKSSQSGSHTNCVELAWRKSSRSGTQTNCVELAATGAVRDSKNPNGPILTVDLTPFLAAIKSGNLTT